MAKKLNQKGLSLIEVMIALTIFATFSLAIISTQSFNIDSSVKMSSELLLHNFAEMKMNEALLGKREFTNATENDIDTGNIDIEGYKDYKFKIEYKKNKFPDFSQIMGKGEGEEENQDENAGMKKMIFNKLKVQLEQLIWQITVTITNPDGEEYSMSSWVTNSKAKIKLDF